mgnify:CR=1 FL=1
MSVPSTCDLCDAHERNPALRVLSPLFRAFGGSAAFQGPAATLQCFEDNSSVRSALEEAGIIRGYHAEIDAVRLGYEVLFFALVGLDSQAEAVLTAFGAFCQAPASRAPGARPPPRP